MRVVVAEVHKNLFDGEAESLSATTTDGEVTILAHHEPFVATLKKGVVLVKTTTGEESFDVIGGVLEVSNNTVTVIL